MINSFHQNQEESSSESDQNEDEDDFAYQLRQERRQKRLKLTDKSVSNGTYVDPTDGSVLEWNPEKRAWLPKVNFPYLKVFTSDGSFFAKVDEDFIAKYQAGYGLTPLDTSALEKDLKATTSAAAEALVDEKEERKRRKQERRKTERKDKSKERVRFDLIVNP